MANSPKSCFSFCIALCFCFLSLTLLGINAVQVSHDGRAITIDGKRRVLISGSIHYPRSTPEMWPDLIKKAKEGGLDAVETYVFWNAHEPARRQYDFTANKDLIRFLRTIQDTGLYAVLRIGPYVCAEWNYGGIPVWVHKLPGVKIRTANDVFMHEMQNFTTLIVDMLKKKKLFASQGGPIIIAQIENEYGNVMGPYGVAGKVYIDWCANLAESYNIGVPWVMCQQPNAPQPMIETCNGWYCHDFQPSNPNSPKMWTENWVRCFMVGPYITTSYDYDALLDEYGNIAQPKWGHLRELHRVLKSMEKTLTYGNVTELDVGNSVNVTVYATKEASSCFISNSNNSAGNSVTFNGRSYALPAWSVSLLPDCVTEEYNTAKVNVQTSIMVKRSNKTEGEPTPLKWAWRSEIIDDALHGKSNFSVHTLFDQKDATNDASDYLWYMTSLKLDNDDPVWSDKMILRINGSGHVIHAFVNGEHIGSHWATYGIHNDKFKTKIKLKSGKNVISILSVTVGLQNYGSYYDTWHAGLVGPIEVVGRKGDETIIKDLSNHKWSYKVGLHGWDDKFFDEDSLSAKSSKWKYDHFLTNTMFTWYKTAFQAPLGKDPVVVDLKGLGKGFAWVNGHSLGRYWPSYIAPEDGCSDEPFDYRGEYTDTKYLSNCGQPTQRWYHVPRSFLKEGVNTLVLFEEFGGNPFMVNFQTVTVGSVCGNTYENNTLKLSCQGHPISSIKFASFGNPQGVPGNFTKGSCESKNDVVSILQNACVGKETCSIDVSDKTFGPTNCGDIVKRLAVEAVC